MTTRGAVAVSFTLSAVLLAACGGGSSSPDATTVCGDGMDNDGDTLADYPADPGCDSIGDADESNEPIAQCTDGRDNDADGLTDFPDDPGCLTALHNDERDPCPGDGCPQCANSADDDGDGATDYPNDNGCMSASDDQEHLTNPAACGTGITVMPLPSDTVTGEFISGGPSELTGSCGGAGDELVYELVLNAPAVIRASLNRPGTTVPNPVLSLRRDCMDAGTEMACNDDVASGNPKSEITASLTAGVYYLIVDNHDLGAAGNFELQLERFPGVGAACTETADCGPGLVCRVPFGQTTMMCSEPVCNDGYDDDDDDLIDYPADPGCDGPGDADEVDDCPDGASCPACGNGIDDDGDGQMDYPADTDCTSASQIAEGCGPEQDPILPLTEGTMMGTLVGTSNDHTLVCGSSGGADLVYFVSLPAMDSITFDTFTSAFDTVLALYPPSCGTSLACNDDSGGLQSQITMTALPAGAYGLVVAAYSTGTGGVYSLHTTGTIAAGGRCDGELAMSGALTCAAGTTCNGTRCVGTLACNNGVDDDGDLDADFPDDPGCANSTDTDEADDCPTGPMCPACSNGDDDDGDGQTDYPADTTCASAAGTTESCLSTEAVIPMVTPTLAGTTVGQTDDFDPSCASSSGSGPDRVYQLDLPATTTVTITTEPNNYDAVVVLFDSSCGGAPLACSDTPETVTRTNLAAGRYFFHVDGWVSSSEGTYQVGVSGTIANGASCDGALAQSGALTCGAGHTCQGPPGSRMCLP